MGKGSGPAAAEPENLGGTAIKPVGWDRTGLEAFKYLLYNPDTGEVLTRTPFSWLKITAFYAVYYSFLTAFWLGCLHTFFLTLPEVTSGPKWTMEASIIGTNPGVGVRPASTNKRIDSQMFVLRKGDDNMTPTDEHGEGDLNIDYAVRMRKFLEVYQTKATAGYESFDLYQLGDCDRFPYGFIVTDDNREVSPCIFIKFNKIWDWKPTPLNETDMEDPENLLPFALKDHWASQYDKDNVWINCDGRYPADKEALRDMMYFPESRGIPAKYFPFNGGKANADFNGGKNYHSPLVAIKIRLRPINVGQLIHVECRAYFQGVKHDTKHKLGLVQFEVMITEN